VWKSIRNNSEQSINQKLQEEIKTTHEKQENIKILSKLQKQQKTPSENRNCLRIINTTNIQFTQNEIQIYGHKTNKKINQKDNVSKKTE
jgi:hypothetical protein